LTFRFVRHGLPGVAVFAALSLPLAACNPVHPGSAAIVGAHAISVDTLQRLTDGVVSAADASTKSQIAGDNDKLAQLQRSILSRLIDNTLLADAARIEGITVTEGEIDGEQAQLAQQAGGADQLRQQAILNGISPNELRAALRGLVISSKLTEAVVADVVVSPAQLAAAYQQNIDQFDQVHLADILVPTKAIADTVLAKARANPASFGSLVQQYSQDTSTKASGGDLGSVGASRLPDFARGTFTAKPGSFVEAQGPAGWYVFRVIAHPHQTLVQATPQLRSSILQNLSQQRLAALLDQVGRKLHVTVNPRYGTWSLKDRAVNAAPNTLSKPIPTPSPAPTIPTGTGPPPSG
jgi:parvulin-like peptidyl-prolyl isomerase